MRLLILKLSPKQSSSMTTSKKLPMPQTTLIASFLRPCSTHELSNIITVRCQQTTSNAHFKILPCRMEPQEYYVQHPVHRLYVDNFSSFLTGLYYYYIRDLTC